MKVAIVGAHTAAGSRLLESFRLGDGPAAVAVIAHPAQRTRPARFNVDLRVADPLDAESLARSFAGCTAVVHTEVVPGDTGRRGATALCRGAMRAGVRRLVFLSSAAVHGDNPPPGTDEMSVVRPRRTGTRADLIAMVERQFFADCRQLNLAGYVLRPSFLYGPRCELSGAVIRELAAGGAWLLQKGEGICNCLHLDNLVAAIRICLKARNNAGQAYLLRDAETVTWREFYHAIARELDLPTRTIRNLEQPPEVAKGDEEATSVRDELAAAQPCGWRLPCTRATTDLGYRPVVSFAEAICRTCAWWRFAQGELSAAA